jgi:TatA/E family protein of Tat protein translocase
LTAFDTVLYDADGRENGYQELMLSIPHMLVVFVIVLVVFGPQKLPELARSLGKLMAEFRKASADFRGAFEQEMKDMERQVREVERKKAADAASKAADEVPVQAATFATAAGVSTTMTEAGELWVGGAGEPAAGASADAFGEPIDARVTEGTAELVVTPVAEAVARTSAGSRPAETATEGTNGTVAAEAESANTNVNGDGSGSKAAAESATEMGAETTGETKGHVVSIDVPHDQQPV